jgi:sugar phosphate isomerase/epimerase
LSISPYRIGFLQGRLIETPGPLQWVCHNRINEELDIGRRLGAHHIELIAEREHNSNNPLWDTAAGRELLIKASAREITFCAICDDYLLSHDLATSSDVLDHALLTIRQSAQLGIRKIVSPLLDASMLTAERMNKFLIPIREMADEAAKHEMEVCLETDLFGNQAASFLSTVDRSNVRVTYDTGNCTAAGHDPREDITALGQLVGHLHIKDKNLAGENVILGTGNVDFQAVFESLHEIGYGGTLSFETARGSNPERTALYNIQFTNFFVQEAANRLDH